METYKIIPMSEGLAKNIAAGEELAQKQSMNDDKVNGCKNTRKLLRNILGQTEDQANPLNKHRIMNTL